MLNSSEFFLVSSAHARVRLKKSTNRRGTDPYARWWGRGGTARCPPIPRARGPLTS
jgi:hypothetical protein